MKGLLKLMIYPAAGLVAFVAALCIFLAVNGQLNASLLKGLPIVGGQADAPAEREEPVETVSTMRYFTSEELTAMLKETDARKKMVEAEAGKFADREKRIEMMRNDLLKEKQELLKMRSELDLERSELKRADALLGERTMEVDALEAVGLRRSAAIHESMDPKKAAAAIATLQRPNAAKLLSYIDEKKAARILQELPPESASELLSLLRQVKANPEKPE